jgi:hypothetical protein
MDRTVWLEYTKLAVSALTPILTGIIGLMALRLGNRLERSRQLNQTLLSKRLSVFDQIAPKLNDIFCSIAPSDIGRTSILRKSSSASVRSIARSILTSSCSTSA